jgi:hypothetical protein
VIFTPRTPQEMNISVPTGGVIAPMVRFSSNEPEMNKIGADGERDRR